MKYRLSFILFLPSRIFLSSQTLPSNTIHPYCATQVTLPLPTKPIPPTYPPPALSHARFPSLFHWMHLPAPLSHPPQRSPSHPFRPCLCSSVDLLAYTLPSPTTAWLQFKASPQRDELSFTLPPSALGCRSACTIEKALGGLVGYGGWWDGNG